MKKQSDIYADIKAVVDALPIYESHDHFAPNPDGEWPKFDLCDILFHNLNSDLTVSGMPGIGSHAATPWPQGTTDSVKKWKVVGPYMRNIENMVSYLGLLRGFKAVYDFPYVNIDDENWAMLNEQIVAAYKREDWIDYVLREKGNIQVAVVDMDTLSTDRDYLIPSMKMDFLMMQGTDPEGIKRLEKRFGVSLRTFQDLLDLIRSVFKQFKEGGAVAIKSVAAYYRTINYADVDEVTAKCIFDKGLKNITPNEKKILQDFVMNEICRLTEESDLPIQFHTGKLAWNFQFIENTNPNNLTTLMRKYPKLKFDVFHGGIPYTSEFGVLANNYPNAYLDINGMQWTSLDLSRRCLSEWIEMVPQNKIMWGADSYRVYEGALGQTLYFREILAGVLADKVQSGLYDFNFAIALAKKIMYENVADFFALQDRMNSDGKK
ncbi:MAG: amidohydrolase family protein [Candidatus Marinimicrobia bacterium]|nr:amidohydrolase family protein [Candidatus Neomarinimicrobiota bacterium]